MREYVVTGKIARFGPGEKLGLSADQFKSRKHNLCFVKSGIFEVVNSVEFKAGEKISLDGEISKSLLQNLEPVLPPVKINAEPAAVKFAAEKDIDLADVKGTGKKGLITLKDVQDLVQKSAETDTEKGGGTNGGADAGAGGEGGGASGLPKE